MAESIDAQATIGRVTLTVRDLDRVRDFYERVLGMTALDDRDDGIRLGTGEGRTLVELVADPLAPPRPPRTTGLFHLAVLVPDRAALARSLQRLIEARWPLAGASDHLVSEALYLSDPEGNGIEIYRDRPADRWRREGGEIQMATLPLDLHGVMAELASGNGQPDALDGEPMAAGRIGHVHLNVAALDAAERFYADLIGLDVTARGYPGALFLAAGGYHHHVGVNTWWGEGAPPAPEGAAGLRSFELVLPSVEEWDGVVERLRKSDVELTVDAGEAVADDPSGNTVRLVTTHG